MSRNTADSLAVARQTLRARSRGMRVLLVDSNRADREAGAELLASVGLEVDAVEDAAGAIDRAGRESYQLLLMEVPTPEMAEMRSVSQIRDLPGYREIPFLGMTKNLDKNQRRRCLAAGMNGLLAKPLVAEELFAMLLRCLPADAPGATDHADEPAQERLEEGLLRSRLESIEDLDLERAMEMALGRTDFLVRLMRLFVRGHADDGEKLRQHLAEGNHEGLRQLMHGIKGVAAMIGARRIVELTNRARAAIHSGDEILTAEVERLADEMDALVAALDSALQAPGAR